MQESREAVTTFFHDCTSSLPQLLRFLRFRGGRGGRVRSASFAVCIPKDRVGKGGGWRWVGGLAEARMGCGIVVRAYSLRWGVRELKPRREEKM